MRHDGKGEGGIDIDIDMEGIEIPIQHERYKTYVLLRSTVQRRLTERWIYAVVVVVVVCLYR